MEDYTHEYTRLGLPGPGMPVSSAHVLRLVALFDSAGVTYPPEVKVAAERIRRLQNGSLGPRRQQSDQADLLTMDESAFVEHLYARAVDDVISTSRVFRPDVVTEKLTAAVVDRLSGEADAIIEQLRPSFDTALDAVKAARELGIGPGMDAGLVIGLGNEVVQAWLGLPEHVQTLAWITDLRIVMNHVLGLPPGEGRYGSNQQNIAALFSQDALGWRARNETDHDLFLRICPWLELLTVEEGATAGSAAVGRYLREAGAAHAAAASASVG